MVIIRASQRPAFPDRLLVWISALASAGVALSCSGMGDDDASAWNAMITVAPFGVLRVDDQAVVQYANAAAVAILGEDPVGHGCDCLAAASGLAAEQGTIVMHGSQALYCWCRQGHDGQHWWWLVGAHDLPGHAMVAEGGADASLAWQSVLASLCHDLRSPLAVVLGLCELLQLDHDEHREFGPALQRIHRAASAIQERLDAERERIVSAEDDLGVCKG